MRSQAVMLCSGLLHLHFELVEFAMAFCSRPIHATAHEVLCVYRKYDFPGVGMWYYIHVQCFQMCVEVK